MKTNQNNTRLGFGLMRLPKKLVKTDIDQVSEMVDLYLGKGFNYFDTAYVYPGSEKAINKALVERYPRDSYTMASKLNAFMAPSKKAALGQFDSSLSRLGIDYFDFYLLHALMENNYKKYEKYGIWDFLNKKREEGKIKHLGFSYHSGPELLDKILTDHPEAEFVQLQLNYADWENPSVQARENYEVARAHNKPIMVMEPVKGGKLAKLPKEVIKLFESYNPDASPASWALRYIASLDGIYTTLSGMSNLDQMKDNLQTMSDFKPLNDEEYDIIRQAQKILGNSTAIECTACAYCEKNCPKNIPIPDIIHSLNRKISDGQLEAAKSEYKEVTTNKTKASECIEWLNCVNNCPQHLPVQSYVKQVAQELEL